MNIWQRIGATLRRIFSFGGTKKRRYEAAGRGRRTNGWRARNTSADSEIRPSLQLLRDRSRDLVRNNGYAKRAVQAIANNVIGKGIRAKAVSEASTTVSKMRLHWMNWAETTVCDWEGNKTFYGIQKQVMQSVAESGECLVVRRKAGGVLRLQVLEADYLDEQKDFANEMGNAVLGVQFDKQGRKIGYWLFDEHPGDSHRMKSFASRFHSIDDVIHIFEQLRPGQVRGVPFGVSVFLRMKDFDEYEGAQLVRQKVAACFTAFVSNSDIDETDLAANTALQDALERVEPGMIEYLKPGETVTFGNPPPAEGYDSYTSRLLHAIASGFGVPYDILSGDLSQVNFSSGRMGWLEFGKNLDDWQCHLIIPTLCQRVWGWFVNYQQILGNTKKEIPARWTVPMRQFIDPKKETDAIINQIQAGLTSWQSAVRKLGRDPDEVLQEMVEDQQKFDLNGIVLKSDYRTQVDADPADLGDSDPDAE